MDLCHGRTQRRTRQEHLQRTIYLEQLRLETHFLAQLGPNAPEQVVNDRRLAQHRRLRINHQIQCVAHKMGVLRIRHMPQQETQDGLERHVVTS